MPFLLRPGHRQPQGVSARRQKTQTPHGFQSIASARYAKIAVPGYAFFHPCRPRPHPSPTFARPPSNTAAELGAHLKLEHLQHTGSFKFRGASNKIAMLTPQQAAAGVITASNGNHGLGVAAAAQARGIDAEVFVSSHVSPAKARRIQAHGARIRLAGDDPLTAELAGPPRRPGIRQGLHLPLQRCGRHGRAGNHRGRTATVSSPRLTPCSWPSGAAA